MTLTMFDELRAKIFVEFAFSLQGMKRARIEHATEGIRIFECVKAMQRFNAQLIVGPMIRRKARNEEAIDMTPFHWGDD
jgi:hypothetical protein